MLIRLLGPVLLVLAIVGCEGKFIGNRPFNATSINGPHYLKILPVTVNGSTSNHLVVVNTNATNKQSHGSIQFYNLNTPANPTLEPSMTVAREEAGNDFAIVPHPTTGRERLFALRSQSDKNRLEWYDFDGTVFVRAEDAQKKALFVQLSAGPRFITSFTRQGDNKRMLAISAMGSGVINVVDVSVETPVIVSTPSSGISTGLDLRLGDKAVGLGFNMRSSTRNELGAAIREGYSVAESVYVSSGGAEHLVTYANSGLAMFSYDLVTFSNNSNFAWNLPDFRNGADYPGGVHREGSRESGFKGIAVDKSGQVFVTNRTDNSLYRLSLAQIQAVQTADKQNTAIYEKNSRDNRVVLDFDSNVSDKIFPRLGMIVLDCTPQTATCVDAGMVDTSGAADRAWVIGRGEEGKLGARVYKVTGLTGTPQLTESSVDLGTYAESIVYNPTGNVLYIGDPFGNRIYVLDADTLALVNTLQN